MTRARTRFALAGPALAAGLLLAMLPGPADAEVFKWVDENGQAHFSSTPPAGRKSDRLNVRSPGPADTAPPARTWQDQVQLSNQRRFQQQKSEQEAATKAAAAQQQCLEARRAVDILTGGGALYRTNAQGEREYMEDGQRSANIENARQRVAAYCR